MYDEVLCEKTNNFSWKLYVSKRNPHKTKNKQSSLTKKSHGNSIKHDIYHEVLDQGTFLMCSCLMNCKILNKNIYFSRIK